MEIDFMYLLTGLDGGTSVGITSRRSATWARRAFDDSEAQMEFTCTAQQSGRHLDVTVKDQVRVEGALLEVDDAHLFERMAKRRNDIFDEIVGQRPGRFVALLFESDRGRLRLADPDRQVAVTVGFAQQQHRLVLGLLHANADHTNLTHLCLPSAQKKPA